MSDAEWIDAPSPDTDLKQLPLFLKQFARDPIAGIQRPLTLTWRASFTLQIIAAILAGVLSGAIEGTWLDVLLGALMFPLIVLMSSSLYTLFIYYFFAVFESTYLDMRRLYTIVILATFPFFLFHAVSSFLPPLDLLGFALTSLLLVAGLCEQFQLKRPLVFKLQGLLFLIYGACWAAVQILTDKA